MLTRIRKKAHGGMVKGDNTPIGGVYMPLYAPQMPLFWLVLYILYYTTPKPLNLSTALQMLFTLMCKKVIFFFETFLTLCRIT